MDVLACKVGVRCPVLGCDAHQTVRFLNPGQLEVNRLFAIAATSLLRTGDLGSSNNRLPCTDGRYRVIPELNAAWAINDTRQVLGRRGDANICCQCTQRKSPGRAGLSAASSVTSVRSASRQNQTAPDQADRLRR